MADFPPAVCYLDSIRLFTRCRQRPGFVVAALTDAGVGKAGCDRAIGKHRQQVGWTIFAHQPSERAMHVLDDAQQALHGIVSRWDLSADWAGDTFERETRHEWLMLHTMLRYRRRSNSMFVFGEEESNEWGTVYWIEHRSRKDRSPASTELVLYSTRRKLTGKRVNHLELRHHRPRKPVQVRDLLQINPAQHFQKKVKLATLDVVSLRKKMLRAIEQERRAADLLTVLPNYGGRVESLLKKLQDVEAQQHHDLHPKWILQTIPMTVLRLPDYIVFPGCKSLQGQQLSTLQAYLLTVLPNLVDGWSHYSKSYKT